MKMKPYDDYKDIEIGWIDKIPSHWEIKRGKSIYKKEERPVREEDEVVTCFRDGQVTLRKNRRLDGFTESIKEIGYQGIRKGDLVIHQMDVFAGAVGVSDSDGKSTPVYSVCNGKVDLNNYYYAFIIREIARNGYIKSLSRGIRERSTDFRFSIFGKEYFPYPPKEEQDKIVEFLNEKLEKIDMFIDLKIRQIELLKEQKEAMINKVATKGLDKSVKIKDSEIEWIGEIPEDWKVIKFKRVINIITDYTSNGSFASLAENVTYLNKGYARLIRLTDLRVDFKNIGIYVSEHAYEFLGNSKLEGGEFLIANVGAHTGYACIMPEILEKATLGPNMIMIKFNNLINYKYALYAFQTEYIQYQIKLKAIGSSAQPSINKTEIKNFNILLPSVEEQNEIVYCIEKESKKIEETISLYQKQIDFIKEYRTSLISLTVTGEIDVREFEEV